MPEHESILQLKSEVQTLKIKDEYRSKELDGLMVKLSDTSTKLNALSENIGRLLAAQDVNRMTDKEFREEMKILHTRIGDLHDKNYIMQKEIEERIDRLDQYKSKLMGMIIVVGGFVGTIVAAATGMFLKD